MYENKDVVGGFANSYYWSSTESGNYYAWSFAFLNGAANDTNKNFTFYVRAVKTI
jgi:hypothetical protein